MDRSAYPVKVARLHEADDIGAYALAAHGAPRATGDIDLWIRPTLENAHRAWQALARFGAPLERIHESDLATPGMVIQIGNEPPSTMFLPGSGLLGLVGLNRRRKA